MMDSTVPTPLNNQDTEHNENLLYDITEIQNTSETDDSLITPVTEIEAPLSPVLTNSKQSLRYIARRKSRIKLMNSFTSQESLQSQTQTPIKEKDICVQQNKENQKSYDLEERMKRCLEIQRNKKFCYDIAKNSLNLPSNTTESCITDLKIIEIPSVDVPKTFVSKTSVENKENDFHFKVPEYPISGTKFKNKVEQKFEPNSNLNIGFETGSGKKITLSERALKKTSKLFDDIIELSCDSSVILNTTNSKSDTNKINTINCIQTEQSSNNIGFKTASGNTVKLSETSRNKTKTVFDDIYDLSKCDVNNIESDILNNKENSSITSFKTTLNKTKNMFDDIYDLSHQEIESESDTSDQDLFDEKNNSLEHKNEFKIPDLIKSNENTSPTKNIFSQITDTQMCWAAESAECMADFEDSQWTPSPKNKSSPKKTQISGEKTKEDTDFLSPEGENFFGNLTVCEDGTVMSRNHLEFEESVEEDEQISEDLTPVFKIKIGEEKSNKFEGNTNLLGTEKAEKIFQDINESLNVQSNKNNDAEQNINLNCAEIMKFGFSTAAGTKIKISEQALKKADNIFQDIDCNIDQISAPDLGNSYSEDALRENDENNMNLQNNEETANELCEFLTAPEKNIEICEESINKIKNIFPVCNLDENMQKKSESSSSNSDKNSENLLQESEQNLEMSLLASVSVRSDFFTNEIDSSTNNTNLNEQFVKEINLESNNAIISLNKEESCYQSEEQDKYIDEFSVSNIESEELNSCYGFTWEEALKSFKIYELYKRSFKFIEKNIKNNSLYPISFTFRDILKSKDYKDKNYKHYLRGRRKSGVIYCNKENKQRRNNSQTLNLSMTTRSKRRSTNEELFPAVIITDTPSTRGRKRKSLDSTSNTSKSDIINVENNKPEINVSADTNVNINKKTIVSLEDDFLNSIENSLNLSGSEHCSYNKENDNTTNCKKISSQHVEPCEINYEHKNVLNNNLVLKETNISDNTNLKISNKDSYKGNRNFGFSTVSGNEDDIKENNSNYDYESQNSENADTNQEFLNKLEENFEDSSINMKTTASVGFSTVTVTETALQRMKNILQDFDICEEFSETPKDLSTFRFATAPGKKVSVSEDALKTVKNIFQDCDVTEKHKNVSSLQKSKNIFENCDVGDQISEKEFLPFVTNSSFGFATASGKKLTISEDVMKKAKNIFQNCDDTEKIFEENIETNKNNVQISDESLKKAKNVLKDCNIEDNLEINIETSTNILSFAFATASGKKVSISEESLKKAQNVFQDCDEKNLNSDSSKIKSSFGFVSASGKKVSVSEEAVKKVKDFLKDCNEDKINTPKNLDTCKNISSFGFASASGKKVSISEEALKKVKSLFQDRDADDFNKNMDTSKNLDLPKNTFGFALASGSKISVSEEVLKKAKTLFQDVSNEETKYSTPQISSESEFATASGKNVNVSEETLNKAKNIFKEDLIDSLSNNDENISEISNLKRKRDVSENNIVLKPDNVQKLSAKKFNKSFSSPQTSSNDSTPILRNKNLSARNSKKRSLGLGISTCKQINTEENSLKRAKLVFDDVDTPKKKETTINNNHLLNYSPAVNTPTVSKSTPNISPQSLLNSSISMKETNQMIKLNLSQTKISPLNICLDENQESFQFRETTAGDVKKWTIDLQKEMEMLKLKMSVIETRMMMMNKQQEIIESGSSDHRRQCPGHLFIQKQNNCSRISLKEAVNNRRPQKNTHQICLNMGLDPSLLNITPENSSNLHFHVPWWMNDNRTYPAVIGTKDEAVIIPNQQNFVGIIEIERAFMAMPGVDPSLVPKKWVVNHYRWIVWKIASMERNYPDVFKDYLSAENVMGQLKYRYDRELYRAQRPAIRKIVECDDTAAKRMVLCVANIIKTENQNELELTDGWYSIRTIIDSPLNSLVEKHLIKIGMKIMTQGAELLNCEGCCPLELPANVRLQIHYNSTRRAAWHLKLGFYPHPGPLLISLRMISGSGGPVGGLIAYIARVYPISFMERSDVSTVWRNERAEMRRANQWEAEYTNSMENVQAKVEEELEKEWREREKRRGKLKIKDVRGIQCGKKLYQFLEESNDPDSANEMLTSAQISCLQEYQSQMTMERQSELSSRLQEKLSKEKIKPRNVSTVLKLLLVDVQSPYHSRMMSIWRPTESHSQILKEGIIVKIYNIAAKNNGTLSSIPRTQFEENSDYDPARYAALNRVVTPIFQTSNPEFKAHFGEYDTVGMVVSVDVQQTMQTLWLADENRRFLTIVIREGPNSCTLFDGITPGKIVSVMNLIHKKPIKSYGESIGNHYTILSSYPQQSYLQEYMQEFINSLPQDVDQYLEECQSTVEGFLVNSSRNNFSLNPFMNSSEKETFCKKLLGLENSQQSKSDSLTLSDEEMALLDTQQILENM